MAGVTMVITSDLKFEGAPSDEGKLALKAGLIEGEENLLAGTEGEFMVTSSGGGEPKAYPKDAGTGIGKFIRDALLKLYSGIAAEYAKEGKTVYKIDFKVTSIKFGPGTVSMTSQTEVETCFKYSGKLTVNGVLKIYYTDKRGDHVDLKPKSLPFDPFVVEWCVPNSTLHPREPFDPYGGPSDMASFAPKPPVRLAAVSVAPPAYRRPMSPGMVGGLGSRGQGSIETSVGEFEDVHVEPIYGRRWI